MQILANDTWYFEKICDALFLPTLGRSRVLVNEDPLGIALHPVKFTTESETWAQIGSLNKARQGHGVIQTGSSFLVVGGLFGPAPTEKCEMSDSQVKCKTMEPTLTGYIQYPELMSVPADFCS